MKPVAYQYATVQIVGTEMPVVLDGIPVVRRMERATIVKELLKHAIEMDSTEVDITSLASHVRLAEGDGHGSHGTVPIEGVDSPWNLRLDISREESHEARTDDVPPAEVVEEELGGGHCPSCARGVVALKGGDGFLSRGRRRLACPNCGWESPEWVKIER